MTTKTLSLGMPGIAMRFCVYVASLVIGLSSIAAAKDIYVSNVSGDDLQDGSSSRSTGGAGGPTQTIAKALRIAGPGDRIILDNSGVPYRESLSLQAGQHSSIPGSLFIIQGNGAILEGMAPVPAWEHYLGDIYRFAPAKLAHQQLFLEGLPATRRPIAKGDYRLPPLEPKEWALRGGHMYFRTEPGKIPEKYTPTYAVESVGITLYKVRGVAIMDLVVQGFQLDGINVHDGDGPCYLQNVTARGNGRAGITAAGASRLVIENSLLGDNGDSQLRVEGLTRTSVRGCEIIANTGPAYKFLSGKLEIDGEVIVPGEAR